MSIKIENTQIFGWEAAIRGARNPIVGLKIPMKTVAFIFMILVKILGVSILQIMKLKSTKNV